MKFILSILGVSLIALAHVLEGGQAKDLYQPLALLFVLGPALFFSLAHHSARDLLAAVRASWTHTPVDPEEAAKHAATLSTPRIIALASGSLGCLIGQIHTLQNLSDPNRLGTGLAIALMSALYALILAELVIAPMIHRFESKAQPVGSGVQRPNRPSGLLFLLATLGTVVIFFIILFAIQPDTPGMRTAQDHEVATFLKANESVGHPVLETELGAAHDAKLVLFSRKGAASDYGAFVVANDQRIEVDPPASKGKHSRFSEVILRDLDSDGVLEVIVMRTVTTKDGPQAAQEEPHNFAVDWDGTKFVVLTELTEKIQGHNTSEEIVTTLWKERALIRRTAHRSKERAKKPKG